MLFPCKWTHLLSLVDCVVRVEWYFRLNLKLSVSRLSGLVWEKQNVTGHICPVIIHHSKGYFLKGRHLYIRNYQPYLCCLSSFSQIYSDLCLFLLFVHLQFLSFFLSTSLAWCFFFHFKGHYYSHLTSFRANLGTDTHLNVIIVTDFPSRGYAVRVFSCNSESPQGAVWKYQCGRRGFKWSCLSSSKALSHSGGQF